MRRVRGEGPMRRVRGEGHLFVAFRSFQSEYCTRYLDSKSCFSPVQSLRPPSPRSFALLGAIVRSTLGLY